MQAQPTNYDLILRGGRVVDPAAGRDGVFDVGIRGGKIAAVGQAIGGAKEIVDVSGAVVLPGLIDTHAHVYQYVTGKFGLNADMCGVRSGVSTLVDQGGPSLMTLPGFRKFIVEPAKSRVVCFLSAYLVGGLEGHYYPSLYGPDQVDVKATVKVALANRDLVKGIKAHGEIGGASRWGVEVMRLAKEISRETKLPLYIHLGQIWPPIKDSNIDPDVVVRDVVALMEAGDVLAHPFTRHPGGFISEVTGKVHPIVWEALQRGVRVDVGHGSHFSFKMARMALEQGIIPFTLGADLHGYNVSAPGEGASAEKTANPFYGVAPFSLCHAMTELVTLGMTFEDVVKTVTSNAAELIGMSDVIGTLAPGRDADVSVIDRVPGAWELRDNSGERVTAREAIVPRFVLRNDVRFDPDSPILAKPARAAA
jgi:dihydroorotase